MPELVPTDADIYRQCLSGLLEVLDPAEVLRASDLEPDPWQERFLLRRARRQLLLCSRQSGKSTSTAAAAVHEALYYPGALVLLFSASQRQAGELFRKARHLYGPFESRFPPKAETALTLHLENGSRILSLPCDPDTVRGYSGASLIVIDEAAFTPDELYYVLTPILAVSKGRLIALSTPRGCRGWFWAEFTCQGTYAPEEALGLRDRWERALITASDCPRIDRTFLGEEMESMGELMYGQEYECRFVRSDDHNENRPFSRALLDAVEVV